MAHHHLLPLILPLVLLILPSSSHATTKAMFSEPLQLLFGGQNLTEGDLTLSLFNDCGLILYKAGIPVLDFNTSTTTSYCALFVSDGGQLILAADNERTPTQTIFKKTYSGRYALLFIKGKLGLFGPANWNNGVKPTTFFNINYQPTLNHEKLKTGSTDYILLSGNIVTGSANGDVVIAQNGKVSTVITKKCAIAVKDDTANKTIWHSWPTSDEPAECFLELKPNGELLLQRYNESGVVTQWKGGYASKDNLYVCLLRYFGGITIYGLKTWLYDDGSSSSSAAAAAAAVVAEKIKMVTA
ncbi:alpha-D-mannose-specific plant lectins domain-containing protein [Dioscorea alata]|uniref:Alpha-D-mannose-specific plant lectins domain-containing protein n=1 Tax=Dioscorea alata TaxID=55571 RepID=A0ACB7VC67_DIOAL|nr:alpha-D-mannose-specific plant lectins domain-containing protein [Dioscorea alata]